MCVGVGVCVCEGERERERKDLAETGDSWFGAERAKSSSGDGAIKIRTFIELDETSVICIIKSW